MDHLQPSQAQEAIAERLQLLPPIPILIIKRELKHALFFLFLLISFVVVFILVSPFDSQPLFFRIGFLSQVVSDQELGHCDYSKGRWVRDESHHPFQSYAEKCPFLDPGFRCSQNGRKDEDYRKWRWQPDGCDLPRYVCMVSMPVHACHAMPCMDGRTSTIY